MAPTLLRDTDPRTVGPWRLGARLGVGALGTVYAASAPEHEPVALKVLRRELSDDPACRRRLANEARNLGGLELSGVAGLLDADLDSETPWLATELIDGPNLADVLAARGPFDVVEALPLAARIARTLGQIHQRGLIHADIKPSNVILGPVGPVLIDLGLARLSGASDDTCFGALVGSPGWLAPEQVVGGRIDSAVDVFAWGALTAAMTLGRSPFGTGRPEALLYRVVHEEPALEDLPVDLRDSVTAALAKNPRDRPRADDLLLSA